MLRIKATAVFDRRARRLLSEDERVDLIAFIGANPEAGDVIPGSGGVRKLRWGMAGGGKRGGARVLQLYLRHAGSLWLLDIYAKREKSDLSRADLKALRQIVTLVKQSEAAP
ncbi:MAG: addiction module toxin RelE [Alphaproteobacteria bacterium]|nr:addiction module toxin RelE [Alphaproteobacteria bacterium]